MGLAVKDTIRQLVTIVEALEEKNLEMLAVENGVLSKPCVGENIEGPKGIMKKAKSTNAKTKSLCV